MPADQLLTGEEAKIFAYCVRAWKNPTYKWETIKVSSGPSRIFREQLQALADASRILIDFRQSKTQYWIFAIRDSA